MINKKMICINEECQSEFTWNKNSPGLYGQCRDCGLEYEKLKGNSRPGGRMVYDCKTNGEIEILSSLGSAQQILKSTNRKGQGRPVGMAKVGR